MRHLTVVVMLLLAGLPGALAGKQSPVSPRDGRRVATLTAGIGNAMGWFGVQAERYLAQARLSAFLGAGYTPSLDQADPSGPTFAVGVRAYTAGVKHRGFLALSVSQLFIEPSFTDPRRLYGPGLEAGYQFASRGGFTVMASLGVGVAPGVPGGQSEFGGMLGIGVGYTWRR